jgi:hypothetical protein
MLHDTECQLIRGLNVFSVKDINRLISGQNIYYGQNADTQYGLLAPHMNASFT